jgi:hypothetical protein
MGGYETLERFQAATPHRVIAVVPWRGAWVGPRPSWWMYGLAGTNLLNGLVQRQPVLIGIAALIAAVEAANGLVGRRRRQTPRPDGWEDKGVLVATEAGTLICRQGKPTGRFSQELVPGGDLHPFPLHAVRLGERRMTIVVTNRVSGDVELRVEDPALALASLEAARRHQAQPVAA